MFLQPCQSGPRQPLKIRTSGEASMVRAIDPNGWPQQMWHMTDGDRWFRLICGVLAGDTEPREIAETFEFLPLPG